MEPLKLEQRVMLVRSRFESDVNEAIARECQNGWRVVCVGFPHVKYDDVDAILFALVLEKVRPEESKE